MDGPLALEDVLASVVAIKVDELPLFATFLFQLTGYFGDFDDIFAFLTEHLANHADQLVPVRTLASLFSLNYLRCDRRISVKVLSDEILLERVEIIGVE